MKIWKGNYKYQVAELEVFRTIVKPKAPIRLPFITMSLEGRLALHMGYAYDGASGPTWDTVNTFRPTAYHDAMYQLMRMELIPIEMRSTIDDEFGRFLEEDGMCWLRRKNWVFQVKNFGLGPATRKPRQIIETPKLKLVEA